MTPALSYVAPTTDKSAFTALLIAVLSRYMPDLVIAMLACCSCGTPRIAPNYGEVVRAMQALPRRD